RLLARHRRRALRQDRRRILQQLIQVNLDHKVVRRRKMCEGKQQRHCQDGLSHGGYSPRRENWTPIHSPRFTAREQQLFPICAASFPPELRFVTIAVPATARNESMAIKPKVFVTRILPDAGLKPIKES